MKLNPNTKKAQGLITNYFNTDPVKDSLNKVYAKPSMVKINSFERIRQQKVAKNGYDLRITGASCHVYSCAYRWRDESQNEWLTYETHCNTYQIPLF